MARIDATTAGGIQVLAFLDTLAWSEIGAAMLAESDDGYNILVGSLPGALKTFPSYTKHPDLLDAKLDSTAAGRYQIIWPTFRGLEQILKLPDFGPVSQDRCAIELVDECGALSHVKSGDTQGAVLLCNRIWASLPGANYGQPEHSMYDTLAAYAAALARYQ
jgi:muramidase (phage lysozyme)